ncbi:MAG: MBL fold metallo-hydrolase RNA specificity domain-containing protein [Leadbetterella sp.]
MKITFHGAAQKVTGSMFLLEFEDEYKVLIDCGSNLAGGTVEFQKTEYGIFPFDASLVNLVILTHAHIDHSGQIPNLYLAGFEGQVLCTSPTMDLVELLLHDAARLNLKVVSGIERSHKKSKKWKSEETEGLYLAKQVEEAIQNFVPIAFNQRFKFKDDGYITFLPAGHLLGAAYVYMEFIENGQKKTIGFSGDIGRENYPLLVNPENMPQVDYLVMETTYGNRLHEDENKPAEILRNIIQEACVDIPGRLIIPSFSVGRTQALLYTLNKLYTEEGFSPIKVFTDSPLGKSSTKVHQKYVSKLNKEAKAFADENDELFDFENLEFISSTTDSKAISSHNEPCIIISASGMIKGGRVEYHIAQNLENPYATILMVGYAAEDSIGGKLLSKETTEVSIYGKKLSVVANIRKTDVFSGHADSDGLRKFAMSQNPNQTKKVFLVHGEYQSMLNFKDILTEDGFHDVELPKQNQTFNL